MGVHPAARTQFYLSNLALAVAFKVLVLVISYYTLLYVQNRALLVSYNKEFADNTEYQVA